MCDDLKGSKILLVGLPKTASLIFQTYGESWGAACEQAETIQEAVQKLRAAQSEGTHYHAAIVPPAVKGILSSIFVHEVSRGSGLRNTRLVLYNLEGERFEDAVIDEGFSAYLSNPVKKALLFDCLNNLVKQSPTSGKGRRRHKVDDHSQSKLKAIGNKSQIILLAEDNPVNQKVALLQLDRLGFLAHAVANGNEVLDALERTHYDLILMDCQMPELDGIQTTNAIRKRELLTGQHIPIIAMTAHAMEGDREHCIAEGMDDYISKPVRPEVLHDVLTKWLRGDEPWEARAYQSQVTTGDLPEIKPDGKGDTANVAKQQGKRDTAELPKQFGNRQTSELPVMTADMVEIHNTDLDYEDRASFIEPVDLHKLNISSKGADLRVVARVYYQTAERVLKEATEAVIEKDPRRLKVTAQELKTNSESFAAKEMAQLSTELVDVAEKSNWTEGKILIEALRLALDSVKSFVYQSQK